MKNTQIQESLNKVWQRRGPIDVPTFKLVIQAFMDVCDPQSARDRSLLAYLREINSQAKSIKEIIDAQNQDEIQKQLVVLQDRIDQLKGLNQFKK
jgi:hypothetical protein